MGVSTALSGFSEDKAAPWVWPSKRKNVRVTWLGKGWKQTAFHVVHCPMIRGLQGVAGAHLAHVATFKWLREVIML